jgi:hypothetical protein
MAATMDSPNPERPRCRRFGTGDSMILIAALAVAVTLCRGAILATWQSFSILMSPPIKPTPPEPYRTYVWIERDAALKSLPTRLSTIGIATICTTIIAHILIRLRHPRPPLSRLFIQPGFAATTSIVLAISYFVYLRYMDYVLSVNQLLVYFCGIVPVVWLILRLSGRGEAESGWIDRFGRSLGWAWIAISIPAIWFLR